MRYVGEQAIVETKVEQDALFLSDNENVIFGLVDMAQILADAHDLRSRTNAVLAEDWGDLVDNSDRADSFYREDRLANIQTSLRSHYLV